MSTSHKITDRREEMSLAELVEELHLRYPEQVASFEAKHRDAMEAIEFEDLSLAEEEDLEDLRDELESLLKV